MAMLFTGLTYFLIGSAVIGLGWVAFDEIRLRHRERAEPGYLDRLRAERVERRMNRHR